MVDKSKEKREYTNYLPLKLPTKKETFFVMQIVFLTLLFFTESICWHLNVSLLYILCIELTAIAISAVYLIVGSRKIVRRQYKSAFLLILFGIFLIFAFAVPSRILTFMHASIDGIHLLRAQDISYYIKFSPHEKEYLDAVKLVKPDDRGFRYKEFIWDYRFGGEGTRLIYDESDELAQPQDLRSKEWWKNIDEQSKKYFEDCLSDTYKIKLHFYVIRINCG